MHHSNAECKYCKKPITWLEVLDKWVPCNSDGFDHRRSCLGSPDYKPAFNKGDRIISHWKEHSTMYIVNEVDLASGYYKLIYYKKKHNSINIPILVIDKKSNICDSNLVEALYG